ncbi:uncharacterized protein LOC105203879 isoform X1 [Solenopsis invicta]|uniref:uncharacterized protein LOC105203879 isoform X1 n=1 Tax=Solenopsis invicta TaxID=13686 RepID=UPI00193E3B48|nr:uncharacterized protein LOC105203879 isoform X1 [Solenopsis invicta]XP_039313319.1 uncharacterized protein LOC105203879 isoform X1 [Solenopsis invicta]XP_039313320.1 uncharacterized protein LOC105203879 isoform X1 [Solenopsis invicta]XP_039313321.1 uncharacterized protein LOC105203879 isoform X1 [Solenopsis invicta]
MDLEEDSLQERLLNVYEPTLNSAQVIYKLLLDALRSKNFHCFKNTIEHHLKKQPPILDINYVYPNTEETCLDIASKNGLKQFVEFLLRQGANPNRVNELYNRAPIHFATEGGHVDTLAALLTEPTINSNLQAGEQTALHIAVKMNDLTCTDLLLKNGASVNIPDSKGLTALHLAATKDHLDIVKLIMEKSRQRPDIDTYRDCDNWTTREVIQHKIPSIVLPPKYENREVNVHDLKYYLIANDEINFLESMKNVKIEDLHSIAEELLEMTALRGFHKAAIGILEKLKGRQFSVKKAMQAAVQQSDRVILQELLKIEPNMANDLILNACQMLGMPRKQRVDNTHDQLECLKLILEQENVNVRCNDNKGNTPLHYAISSGCQEAIILLLHRGSYIGHMNKFNIPPIADISAHTLSRYFDDCLQTRKDRTNECTIEFNYRCLMPHNVATEQDKTNWTTHEMEIFKYIAGNSGLKPLLKHPLLSSFLYLKWHRIRHILYANFVFYIIFYLLLNAYIFNMTYDIRRENKTQIANESVRISESTLGSVPNNFLWGFTTIMLLLFILREIFQLISCVKRYLMSLRNWLEIMLIMFTVAALCGAGLQIGALVILLSACELVILISQHPRLSTGIEMFRTVSFNFIRFLFPYLFLIFAFALAFYTLFKDGNDTNFLDPGLSLFKTVIMLTGEFDANDIPFISHPIWSHIVFMLFVFFIAIVLFNLLNGLAVSDTAEILSKAELVGLVSRIRLVAYIEEIVVGKSFRYCFCSNSRWNPFRFLPKRILLFPHFLKDGKIIIKPGDNSDAYDNDRYYEKDIHSKSIKRDKQWSTSIMDPDIIKQAKRIIWNKNQLTDNKMDLEEDSLQERLLNVYEPTLNSAQVIYKLLLDALRSKNFHCFKNTIEHHLKKQPPILDINYVYPNTEETCLDIASKNGLKQFVEFLLRQGANPNRVNELYNRAPIHFATEGGHVDTLAALLTEPTINPNLQAGEQTALHIAVRMNDLTCTDLLLKNGASVNIPDSKGLTALHLAATKDHLDIVKLIMEKSRQRPDIDTYRDCDNWTTREVIQHKIPSIVLPPKYENREVNVHDLKYYLNANDEINFLESMKNVKIEDLHSIAEELLEMTALQGFHKAAIGILEKLKGRQFSVKKAMQAAVQQSDHVILQELLKIEPNVANDLILNACQMLGMPRKQRVDNTHDQLECLKLILEQENVNVRCNDNKGNTPLHYAISSGCQEAMILLLHRGSYIGHMNKFNIPPIADISTHTLSRYFDDCLQTRKDRTNKCTIEFNYRCLMPHNVATEQDKTNWTTHEMEVFKYIAGNSGLKPLLKHPLLSSFLYLKWHRIRHILYANFVFYIIFYLLLNAYIFNMTYDIRRENETEIANESIRISKSTLGSVPNNFLWGFTTIMLLLFILREIFQLISCVKRYLMSLRNWLEIMLIMFTVAALCGAGPQIGALVILLSACELVILISQHPRLSTGIEMFRTVSFNFIRFLFPYLFLIFAFALAFYTLFKDGNDTNFLDPGLSIFKTVIMLTGEFDANNIPFISHPVWSHIVFILFVFFIVIILFNLLNGLAVSDTAEILSKAELVGLVSRIRLVAYIEEIVVGKSFRHCFCSNSRWNPFRFLAKRILLFPYFLKDEKIIIKLCDNSDAYDNDRYYEKDIHSESIKRDKQWNTSIMNPDIIKQAKLIIWNKNQLTGNEKIIAILNRLQEKVTTIEITLKTTKFTE